MNSSYIFLCTLSWKGYLYIHIEIILMHRYSVVRLQINEDSHNCDQWYSTGSLCPRMSFCVIILWTLFQTDLKSSFVFTWLWRSRAYNWQYSSDPKTEKDAIESDYNNNAYDMDFTPDCLTSRMLNLVQSFRNSISYTKFCHSVNGCQLMRAWFPTMGATGTSSS